MPRPNDPLHTRRAAQLKALAQVRNTLPASDRDIVADLMDLPVEYMQDWKLEAIDRMAGAYLSEVVS